MRVGEFKSILLETCKNNFKMKCHDKKFQHLQQVVLGECRLKPVLFREMIKFVTLFTCPLEFVVVKLGEASE